MEQLVNFIIRPPRAEYNPKHDLLDQEFMLKGKWYQRKDLENMREEFLILWPGDKKRWKRDTKITIEFFICFSSVTTINSLFDCCLTKSVLNILQVKNSRGDVLQCSHYVPIISPGDKPLPCVIYCHGNSGCRADASEAAIILLPSNITVFALDFSGSGLSGGDHVTLGWNEKDDLRAVVDYLRQEGNVSLIGLWGRSMGAVTSLMYGAEDPSIAGMVLDSPFSDLVELMMELVDTYKFRFPKFTVKFAIQYMRRAIQKKAKFDIMDLNTIKVAKSSFVPVLFGHGIDDDFIHPHHSDRIYEAYMGDKNIIKFEGDHNSPRPQFYFDSINIFFHNVLQPPVDMVGGTYFEPMHEYFGKDSWSTLQVGYNLEARAASKEPSTSTTADAIKQVRSKRPMSRMEVPSEDPSQDNQSDNEHEETGDKLPSSSNMISFELSNGQPFGPHVPTISDDQFVEYQLEDLAGFPCDVQEEERMLMEAVIESLKDMEMQRSHADQTASGSPSTESSQKDKPDSSPIMKHFSPLETKPTLAPVELHDPSKRDSTLLSGISGQNSAMEQPSPDTCSSSTVTAFDTMTESGSATTSTRSDASESIQSSTDTDLSGNTKATLTVERSPASHVMDGLMRRWDFNFFRNNR